jgi:hypothetical protein
MAIRKSMQERFTVKGQRDAVLSQAAAGLQVQGFKDVREQRHLGQVSARYKSMTLVGDVLITVLPSQAGMVQVELRTTAAVDNVFALFGSPNAKLLSRAKAAFT